MKWTIGKSKSASASLRKQAHTQGGCTGCTCPPPSSTWEKSSAQKCPKEQRKVRPDMSAKKNVYVPLRYHKIKTKKLGKNEENSKRKGLKLKKYRKRLVVCRNYTVDFSRLFTIIVVLYINK